MFRYPCRPKVNDISQFCISNLSEHHAKDFKNLKKEMFELNEENNEIGCNHAREQTEV